MINRIIDFSVRNKFIIVLFTLALLITGIWSMTKVPIDAVPDITNNQVQVITKSPELGTEDIEQFVTHPVELAMSNLPDVTEIRSVSRFGLSVVTIVFDDAIGTYLPRQLVAEKLPEVLTQIPSGFGQPVIGPIATGLSEIYQYTLEVDPAYRKSYSLTELRSIQDWIVRRQMAMVPGVVEVNAFGGSTKQYEVAIVPGELRAMGLTITDVFSALESNNQNTGGAYIERNHQAHFIRGEGLARSVTDIENMVVSTLGGVPVKIKDIGTVSIGSAVRYGALTKDGIGETVGGMILMLKGASSNEVIEAVQKRMVQIQKSLPDGISIVPFLDRSELIDKTTGTVTGNLLEGGLIVIFILVLLLGNWRGGLIVASTIPLSLLFAFVLMYVFDVWANLMSLGAIDFGIIVDGAVIIVESTVFLMYSRRIGTAAVDSEQADTIASTASKKMMNTAFFGQLIILIVFLPILALEGVEGKMFRPMALTFIFAMIGAMVLCLTYVPMMSALFLRPAKTKLNDWGDRLVLRVEKAYEPLLVNCLRNGKKAVAIAIGLLTLTIIIFIRMGGEFIPQLDEGDIAFHAILKPGSSLTESIETTTKIERIIKAGFPEAENVISRIGVADVATDPMPMDMADVFVLLKPRGEWTSAKSKEELIAQLKDAVSILPGVNFEFTQPIEMRFNELLTGVRENVAIKLFGEDLNVLAAKAEEMGKIIAEVPGVADMKVEATEGLPQITISYNRDRMAQYGLDIASVNTIVQAAFAGGKAGVIFEGEKRYDLVVRLAEENRSSISDIQKLFIQLPGGAQIPLREIAEISYEPGPMQISRDNTNRRTYVGINIRNRDVASVVGEIQERLDAELDLPPGYHIRYGGAFENLERAGDRLRIVVPVALLLIFVLIYFALKSLSQTLMIYIAIPLSVIGGVCALWLRDMPFSISAGVGFIVLFGVAVLNGLVMVSGWNELKEEGVTGLKDRILQGSRRRIRPIMLTALTDVMGFLPMAISTTAGAEVQRPLATVVIGGLITSTLLTLCILPIFYQWMEKRSEPGRKKRFSMPSLTAVLILSALFFGLEAHALQTQDTLPPIYLDKAVSMSRENYPLLKTNQLELQKQAALQATAYDLGNTQIFTGGEEIGRGQGVYTIVGLGQQNMDVLGIPSKKKLQRQRLALAETVLNLSVLQVEQETKKAWSEAFQQKRRLRLYIELDSIYRQFQTAVRLNFEVEAISRLEFDAARSQALNIGNQLQQIRRDYDISLQKMNLWLASERFFGVPDQLDESVLDIPVIHDVKTLHPEVAFARGQLEEAKANHQAAKAELLPKLSFQGGLQEIDGSSGYYSYQAGISVPLLSGVQHGQAKAARIDTEIAETSSKYREQQWLSASRQAWITYQKWLVSWEFYRDIALPLAGSQRKAALLAYKEGAADYATFTQIIGNAIEAEFDAQDSLHNYLMAVFDLQYYDGIPEGSEKEQNEKKE